MRPVAAFWGMLVEQLLLVNIMHWRRKLSLWRCTAEALLILNNCTEQKVSAAMRWRGGSSPTFGTVDSGGGRLCSVTGGHWSGSTNVQKSQTT